MSCNEPIPARSIAIVPYVMAVAGDFLARLWDEAPAPPPKPMGRNERRRLGLVPGYGRVDPSAPGPAVRKARKDRAAATLRRTLARARA